MTTQAAKERPVRVRIGSKRQITLPRKALDAVRARQGDIVEVRFRREDGIIELVPLALIPRDQLWFWTPEWQAKEREADEDIKAGHVETSRSADELIRSLRRARKRAASKARRSDTPA
jgi:bifunctional DNA-binding transcriptional regulator/antitoxin component of YhaV-PrlF toxin-antitoxin module